MNTGNIYLIGMMGAGKTSVGKLVASQLHRTFIDLDSVIEKRAGKPINDIFNQEGESKFRNMERDALLSESLKRSAVIATGGGIVLNRENHRTMNTTGTIILLEVDPKILKRRLKDATDRPLLKQNESLNSIWNKRKYLYRKAADITINGNQSLNICVSTILSEIS